MLNTEQFNECLAAYLECALWSSSEESLNEADVDDIHSDCIIEATSDLKGFLDNAERILKLTELSPSDIGYDYWLTREGHGAGFWDRGLGKIGDDLTKISKWDGTQEIYLK